MGTETLPWETGLQVTSADAEKAIRFCFPEIQIHSVKFLKAGWDSSAFVVNDDLIFRFPKRKSVEGALRAEIQVLAHLREIACIAVPKHQLIGAPTKEYPFMFSGYPMIQGTRQTDKKVHLTEKEIKKLFSFFQTLHALRPEDFPQVPPDDSVSKMNWLAWLEDHDEFEEQVSAISRYDGNLAKRVRGYMETFDWSILEKPFTSAIIHNDFLPEHVLIGSSNEISGIIDWGDVAVGDPAVDYAGIGTCFGLEVMNAAIQEGRPADVKRVTTRANLAIVTQALDDIWYAENQGDKELVKFTAGRLAEVVS